MSQPTTPPFKSIQAAGGHARAASMTPEQRTACAKKASAARWQFRNGSQITGTPDAAGPYRGNNADGAWWKAQSQRCAVCKAPSIKATRYDPDPEVCHHFLTGGIVDVCGDSAKHPLKKLQLAAFALVE